MEPLRPVVDRKLVEMIRSRSFAAADFILHPYGVVRLNPKLARYIATSSRIERQISEGDAGSIKIIKAAASRRDGAAS